MLSRFYIFKSASALSIIFFFQSEDRIRYRTVTGVQTCALPLYRRRPAAGIRYLSGVAPGPDLCPAKIARIRPFRPPHRRRSPFVRSVPLLMTRDPPICSPAAGGCGASGGGQIWAICRVGVFRFNQRVPLRRGVSTPGRKRRGLNKEAYRILEVFEAMGPEPFTVQVPVEVLDDLRSRLARTRWPDRLPYPGWAAGADIGYLRELVAYWASRFDWRAQERHLNSFAQFTADIDGQRVHFVHQRGGGPDPFPLVLTHGWPGSFAELLKLVPLLTDPASHGGDARDSFDVVIPSLPGYAFSAPPAAPGAATARTWAGLWARLMTECLGYPRFGAQGQDIGAAVSIQLAAAHPGVVAGIHVPGLAAWIVEKFRAWSDCEGDVERRFSKDELLTTVTLYWVTGAIGSSFLFYHDSQLDRGPRPGRVEVPVGVALFPKENPVTGPREWAERSEEHTSELQS